LGEQSKMIQALVGAIVSIAGVAMLLERSWAAGCILLLVGAGLATGPIRGTGIWFWVDGDGDGDGGGDGGGGD
jgi:hypothetical protein